MDTSKSVFQLHGVGFFGEADFVQEVGAPAFVQLGKLDATKIGMKPALQRIIGLVSSRPWVMNLPHPPLFLHQPDADPAGFVLLAATRSAGEHNFVL